MWLKFRNLTLRVLAASAHCAKSLVDDVAISSIAGDSKNSGVTNGESEEKTTVKCRNLLESLTNQFSEALTECKAFKVPDVSSVLVCEFMNFKRNLTCGILLQYPLSGPFRTRMSVYVQLKLGEYLAQVSVLVCNVHRVIDSRAGAFNN